MALPLIPFAVGIAVGTLLTYGVRDKALRERVVHAVNDARDRTKRGLAALWERVPDLGGTKAQVEESAAELRAAAGEAVEGMAEKTLDVAERLEEAAEDLRKPD